MDVPFAYSDWDRSYWSPSCQISKDGVIVAHPRIARIWGGCQMKMSICAAVGAALFSAPAFAQEQSTTTDQPVAAEAAAPMVSTPATVTPAPLPREAVLAANTPITLSINSELSSRDAREGDTFPLTVVSDIVHDGHVVIPRGTRAMGEVVWRTGRGSFGKSGKMEVAMRYLEMDGRRIPLEGLYRQEGEGNTGATIGAVIGAGVIGGLVVTGRSARIPAGRELPARTLDNIPVVIPPPLPGLQGTPAATIAATYVPSAVQTGRPETADQREDRLEREARAARRASR